MRFRRTILGALVGVSSAACGFGEHTEQPSQQALAVTGDSVEVKLDVVASDHLFTSSEDDGICYRIPSLVRAGNYLVAIAGKRFGRGKNAKQYLIPAPTSNGDTATLKDADPIRPCADETPQSLVARIATLNTGGGTVQVGAWSNEVTLMDYRAFRTEALSPTSKLFRPDLYDYVLRLQNGMFTNPEKTVFADSDEATYYRDFLVKHLGSAVPDLESWLRDPVNAYSLIPLRFGAQSAVGHVIDHSPMLTVAAVLAAPLTPLGVSNDLYNQEGLTNIVAAQFDVQRLYDKAKAGPYSVPFIDPDHVTWNYRAGSDHAEACAAASTRRLSQAQIDAAGQILRGLDTSNSLPHTLASLEALIGDYHEAQYKTFTENVSTSEFTDVVVRGVWIGAVQEAYHRRTQIGWEPASDADKQKLENLLHVDAWSDNQLSNSFDWLGISNLAPTTAASRRMLALVRGIYLRRLNANATKVASTLKGWRPGPDVDPAVASVLQEAQLAFEKGIRVGPGNGVELDGNRLFFPSTNNPMTLDAGTLRGVKCMDGRAITGGSERQAAILGTRDNRQALLMTMRKKNMPLPNAKGVFDLSEWTRTFSVSWNDGDDWQQEIEWKPAYPNPLVDVDDVRPLTDDASISAWVKPYDATPGFKDSQVQGSITAVPNFFGAGKNLVIHGHPQNNVRGMTAENTKRFEIPACVGTTPGDATKSDERCDFRSHYTLIPGRALLDGQNDGHPVSWSFNDDSLRLTKYGAGYSALTNLGALDCASAGVGALVEVAQNDDGPRYRGFNDAIGLFLVSAKFVGQGAPSCP